MRGLQRAAPWPPDLVTAGIVSRVLSNRPRRAAVVIAIVVSLAACGGSDDDASETPGSKRTPLTDVVLRLADFPDDYERGNPDDFSLDFDGLPDVDGAACPPGLRSTDFADGVVAGDPVVKGNPERPPFVGSMSIAARVSDPKLAQDWINSWRSPDAQRCVAAESNVGGSVEISESRVGTAQVVSIRQSGPDAQFMLFLIADGPTVGGLVIVDGGAGLEPGFVDALRDKFARRLSS